MKLPTIGGKQFWTDHAWRQGWRIQQNEITGSWRLLDASNRRHASGDRAHCQLVLDDLVADNSVSASQIVILVHGLLRSAASMRKLGRFLEQNLDCQPLYFEYASTRRLVPDHAQALREVIEGLPEQLPIHFVGHSMGNIVVRLLLGDLQRDARNDLLERIRSVVMLGPPNQGASFARQLARIGVLDWITGCGGQQLGPNWNSLQSRLATPHCPFGIIAGRIAEPLLNNPLLDGQGDFVVTVDETRLEGATDHLEVSALHSFLMDCSEAQNATLRFIQSSSFKDGLAVLESKR